GYGSLNYKLPETLEEAYKNDNSFLKAKEADYGDNYGKYKPNLKKEQAEIDKFVLDLLLGTALMSHMQNLLDKINAIK
ncbi:MAG: hypothetical protein Q7K43_02655, partial [Candidatus Woesearchaeota archaeon]|nr:hypothetical protein [Candidatus Woesearchaeota archaeon]